MVASIMLSPRTEAESTEAYGAGSDGPLTPSLTAVQRIKREHPNEGHQPHIAAPARTRGCGCRLHRPPRGPVRVSREVVNLAHGILVMVSQDGRRPGNFLLGKASPSIFGT